MPVVAVVVVPVDIAGIEVHVPRVVRVVRIEGRGPVVAVGTNIVEVGVVPVACGRKAQLALNRPPDCMLDGMHFRFPRSASRPSPDGSDFIEFIPHAASSTN